MTRDEIIQKIIRMNEEAAKAGPVHRRDLQRQIRRLARKLRTPSDFLRDRMV